MQNSFVALSPSAGGLRLEFGNGFAHGRLGLKPYSVPTHSPKREAPPGGGSEFGHFRDHSVRFHAYSAYMTLIQLCVGVSETLSSGSPSPDSSAGPNETTRS